MPTDVIFPCATVVNVPTIFEANNLPGSKYELPASILLNEPVPLELIAPDAVILPVTLTSESSCRSDSESITRSV